MNKEKFDTIPESSYDLIQLLDHYYPERCPSPEDPERKIWMYSGAREPSIRSPKNFSA